MGRALRPPRAVVPAQSRRPRFQVKPHDVVLVLAKCVHEAASLIPENGDLAETYEWAEDLSRCILHDVLEELLRITMYDEHLTTRTDAQKRLASRVGVNVRTLYRQMGPRPRKARH